MSTSHALPSARPRLTRAERTLWIGVAVAVAVALGAAATHTQTNPILAAIAGCMIVAAWHRKLLAWPTLLGYVIVVVLFIPIRRYTVAGGGPISLEPYRLLIAGVLAVWLAALLVDPATRLRKTGLEWPLGGFALALVVSIVLNLGMITSTGLTNDVVKQVSFFVSFLALVYFVVSAISTRAVLDRLLVLLVGGGALVALCSIVEWRTGLNVFNHLQRGMPLLHLDPEAALGPPTRGGRPRAYGSAQHPIALGAALVLLIPLAIYLHRRLRHPIWLAAGAVLTLGALATGSRTVALMLVAELVVFYRMKRAETVRLLPLLVPLFVVVQVVMPGTLGTFKAIIFPEQGLVAEQSGGGTTGSGRLADLGPSLAEWYREPFFGQGFGTRLTSETDKVVNALILDNEWLGTLLEVGAVGTICLLWMYVRSVRQLGRAARADDTAHGWLLAGLAAGITAFAVGMFTYDAFSFIQVTVMSFVLIGLGVVALRIGAADREGGAGLPDGRALPADAAPGRA